MTNEEIHIHTHVEAHRAATLEAMVVLLGDHINEAHADGRRVVSVSHAVDREDPDGEPYSFLLFTETR